MPSHLRQPAPAGPLPPGGLQLFPLPVFDTNGLLEAGTLSRPVVFLRPGDWFFGGGEHCVTTVLGSCVSAVMWSPRLRLGAMSHCLLSSRPDGAQGLQHGAGHYVDEALHWMAQRLSDSGCWPSELEVTLAGGAAAHDASIGRANVARAVRVIDGLGMRLIQQDTGGRVVRRMRFSLADGCLTISHGGRLGQGEA